MRQWMLGSFSQNSWLPRMQLPSAGFAILSSVGVYLLLPASQKDLASAQTRGRFLALAREHIRSPFGLLGRDVLLLCELVGGG